MAFIDMIRVIICRVWDQLLSALHLHAHLVALTRVTLMVIMITKVYSFSIRPSCVSVYTYINDENRYYSTILSMNIMLAMKVKLTHTK